VQEAFVELEEDAEGEAVHQAGQGFPAAQGSVAQGFDMVADAFKIAHAAVEVLHKDGLALGELAAGEVGQVSLHGQLDLVDDLLVEADGLNVLGGVGEENGLAGKAQALVADAGDAPQFAKTGGDGLFGIVQQLGTEVGGFGGRGAGGHDSPEHARVGVDDGGEDQAVLDHQQCMRVGGLAHEVGRGAREQRHPHRPQPDGDDRVDGVGEQVADRGAAGVDVRADGSEQGGDAGADLRADDDGIGLPEGIEHAGVGQGEGHADGGAAALDDGGKAEGQANAQEPAGQGVAVDDGQVLPQQVAVGGDGLAHRLHPEEQQPESDQDAPE